MGGREYFASFVGLPVIIRAPGQYITRGGEMVTVDVASTRHDFGCEGVYSTGQDEAWHKSGRLFAGRETSNDIIRAA